MNPYGPEMMKVERALWEEQLNVERALTDKLAAALLHYQHWFGEDCVCDGDCPLYRAWFDYRWSRHG